MGGDPEPWEFADEDGSRTPFLIESNLPHRGFTPNTRFVLIAGFCLLGLLAALLCFTVVWDDAWSPAVAAAVNAGTPWLRGFAGLLIISFAALVALGTWRAIWFSGGFWIGAAVAVMTFLGGWASAVGSWGWLLGIAFGWFPAAIVGLLAGAVAWALTPLLVAALVGGLAWWVAGI